MTESPLPALAINGMPLLSPRAGIGQYTFHLVTEMQSLWREAPWLFYGGGWGRDIRFVSTVTPTAQAKRAIGRWLPDSYRIARFLEQRRFSAGVREHGIRIYHEPNYLAFRFDGPTIVTIHDLSWIHYAEMHPAERVKMMNEIMPGVVRRASQIIVDSAFIGEEVKRHYGVPGERLSVVPLGVSPDFRPMQASQCGDILAAHRLRFGEYLLAVGTLEPRKNLATAIRAFIRLPEETRRRLPLVVVGMDGWGADRLPGDIRDLADRGEVRLLGYVPQSDMPALYSGARMLIYASVYEGFGLPPLEAMACGTPVIASRRASLPEVVGDAGVLVEPLDDHAIAASMRKLLDDANFSEGRSAAGIVQASRFSWRKCALETVGVYRKAIVSP